jgi:S-DNA-T family DNA segregation ATPase FtsK/SpoIIIE
MAFSANFQNDDDVLMEPTMRTALQKRATELVGVALLALATVLGLILNSYNPNDPSFFNSTSLAPTNSLGVIGAHIADPMIRTLGWASWGAVVWPAVWGLRLILHRGQGRVWTRLAVAPFAIVAGAMFASVHSPDTDWVHAFGLGGLIGDSADRFVLELAPMAASQALLWVTLGIAALTFVLALLALGVDWREFRGIFRFLGTGVTLALRVAGSILASLGVAGLRAARKRVAKPRSERVASPEPIGKRRIDPDLEMATPARKFSNPKDDPKPISTPVAEPAPAAEKAPPVRREPTLNSEEHMIKRIYAEVDKAAVDHSAAAKRAPMSRKAKAEAEPMLDLEDEEAGYVAPPLALLSAPVAIERENVSDEALEENARMLEAVLDDYGIRGEIVSVRPGPVVTMYELEPAPGLKASRVIGLADDIARSMSALAARVSTVPGRSIIGIELPNVHREKVLLREILSSRAFGDAKDGLLLALGKDIAGEPVIANLQRMPHLLIAGTTGSGKSVAVNTMILSLLYRLSPKECRLIMIDPKMLELSVYDDIPHLLSPVVTDPKKAIVALKWTVAEMEERYRKMSKMGVRNLEGYNARVREALEKGESFSRTVQTGFDDATGEPIFEQQEFEPEEMPMIVVIVDEMADLMMVAGKEIEACIQRLAQMARASGIHLIMATQRPSVDVITGTIKANFPTRISFQVTSKIDSRTILGEQGAEQLLGMGDMLYMAGGGRITRVHGPFVSDEEVEEVVNHLKGLGAPEYVQGVTDGPDDDAAADIDLVLGLGDNSSDDELYDQAVQIVARERKCSTSFIQRKLAIGYNRAARLVEQMEEQGVVSQANHVGKREVLVGEV